jgi:hypothetical protein
MISAAAVMATAVSAGGYSAASVPEYSTVYTTEEVTITSCAATVTNCPARSTTVSKTTYPVTSYPAVSTSASVPVYSNSSSSAPYVVVPSTYSAPVSVPVYSTKSSAGVVVPTYTPVLSTITISTCVPTVIYSTVTVTPTSSKAAPSSTGTITYAHNVTAPSATATPSVYATGAASTIQGSMIVAAIGGIAAFLL